MTAKKAAKKKDVRSLLRKQLGKETADALLNRVDKMAKKGATASAIDKAIAKDLSRLMRKARMVCHHNIEPE